MELVTSVHSPATGWTAALPSWDGASTLVLAFGASELVDQPQPLDDLREWFSSSHLVGCSTAGEIFGATVADGTLAVAVMRFESARLKTASADIASQQDSFAAGKRLAEELGSPSLRAVLVFSDGLNVNGSELVRGLSAGLPAGVIVTGGLAGDGDRFGRTWVISGGRPRPRTVTAVGLYGDSVDVRSASRGGWDIFGVERVVTRSAGNVLHELDGRPALELYKEYLGDRAAGLPATALLFPLSLRTGADATARVVRTILSVDEDAQSLTFAGDIPQGARAQLMRASIDRLVQGASDAAGTMGPFDDAGPVLSIAISCVGRRLVMGQRTEEETEATLDALPAHAQQIGFYSYGEISPQGFGTCELHNQTMTLTTIREL